MQKVYLELLPTSLVKNHHSQVQVHRPIIRPQKKKIVNVSLIIVWWCLVGTGCG